MKRKLLITYTIVFTLATIFYSIAFPKQKKKSDKEGQKYNHQSGLLKPDRNVIDNQLSLLK